MNAISKVLRPSRWFLLLLIASPFLRAGDLPSRNPRVVVPLLKAFPEEGGFGRVRQLLGQPESVFVSGFAISVFRLDDGTSVYVKTSPDRGRLYDITRSAPGQIAQNLYEPLRRGQLEPPLTSAPF